MHINKMSLPGPAFFNILQLSDAARLKTMHENERDHILAVLKSCNGRVWGSGAAAEMLNIPPSTLKSKMKKFGISREYIERAQKVIDVIN